jgi:ABC-type multidrug transport system permease subunit
MLRVLLAKDLRHAVRNPLPWIINLIVPLSMTLLVGLIFGRHADSGALGRIRFAVVDEDKSLLGDLLRGVTNQAKGGRHFDPVFMGREAAMREIDADKISAVLIIPANFMSNYLRAREPVSLELIKNPAESVNPAVLEELLGVVATGLNAISHNFRSKFPEWRTGLEGSGDYHQAFFFIERTGAKLMMTPKYKNYINPPLVSYEKEPPADASTSAAPAKAGGSQSDAISGVFSYLLIGFSGMFLLFIAGSAMSDLYRELRQHTLERYQTLRDSLAPFLASKAVFGVVMLLLCAAIMLGGGGLIFHIHWRRPLPLMALTFGYACFMAALFAVFVALMPDERRAAVLNNLAAMFMGLAGGVFPPELLPAFLRQHITPFLPSYWFVTTARNLQDGGMDVAWGWAAFKFAALGAALIALAAMLLRRRFQSGLRA